MLADEGSDELGAMDIWEGWERGERSVVVCVPSSCCSEDPTLAPSHRAAPSYRAHTDDLSMPRRRPSTLASARSVEPPRRVVYGAEHPCQYADLWLPSGGPEGPQPVAVLVHGGSWTCKWCCDLHGSMAAALAAEGWAVWNLEYRRVGWEDQPGGERPHEGAGYPGTLQDVAQGLNGLAALHDAEPELRLDLTRVVIIGHSSGGHLALWASQAHRSPLCAEAVRVKPVAVVALGPATDLLAEFGARHNPPQPPHLSLPGNTSAPRVATYS